MKVLRVRNVNEALVKGLELMNGQYINEVSPRGRKTREYPEPVCTAYTNPEERVLFNGLRDANPFFHFFEALWMLQGRDDVAFVAELNKRMKEFSDDGQILNGAYGQRWRSYFGFDQIDDIITILNEEPASRRAVLTMWDADADLMNNKSKDVPCNTQIYFKVRDDALRMTICNRSNDMIWGAYGANAVHMSMLMEYVADKLGLLTGEMYQMSDSFHVYTEGPGGELWRRLSEADPRDLRTDFYAKENYNPYPLDAGHPNWDSDLLQFFGAADSSANLDSKAYEFKTPFFINVVRPMWRAWKMREMKELERCGAEDWRRACTEWLMRRKLC